MDAMAADASPELDAKHGFTRSEMFSEHLAGTWKGQTDVFLFLICGKAEEWPEDVKDLPEDGLYKALQDGLKAAKLKSKIKVAVAEATAGDKEGDVLVFPGAKRFNIAGGTAALVEALKGGGGGGGGSGPPPDVEDAHVFVCAHTRRDARCGHCGPRLLDAIAGSGSAATVRKCSHVGGHAYAGNVLVFQPGGCGREASGDFYGYVTPTAVADVLSGRARRGRLWRGALGLSPEGARRERRVQLVRECCRWRCW
mmetsp:Transcript_108567/g.338448  ORF Transcript_108567/g.338448 Transcript_108567/m.338448 type:complete len:254 (+) Transcript_108567:24-785(+)